MDNKINNSLSFKANLIIKDAVKNRIPKHFNIEKIQQEFAKKTSWYAKDMFLTTRKEQIIATLDKDDYSENIIGMLNITEMTDENRFLKKMLYSYRMIMQSIKLDKLNVNRLKITDPAYNSAKQRSFNILDRLGQEFPDLYCNAILIKHRYK